MGGRRWLQIGMTLVSLEAAAAQQGGPQPASRKRPAPQEQPERESRRPRRASRPDGAQCSADGAQAAEAQPPAAAAAPAATRSVDPVVVAERAAMAAAKQAEAERRRGELLEAYQVFQEQETQRLMFMEVDAGGCSRRHATNKHGTAANGPAQAGRPTCVACALGCCTSPRDSPAQQPGLPLFLGPCLPAPPTRPPTDSQASCRRGGWRAALYASTGLTMTHGTWAK